jgi:hypothetical protein
MPVPAPVKNLVALASASILLASACAPAHEEAAVAAPSVPSAPVDADIRDADLADVRARIGCGAKPDDVFCRALAAFAEGRLPAARPALVSLPGATMLVPAAGTPDQGKPPVLLASFLVLDGIGVRFQTILPSNDDERRDSLALVRAVAQGQPLPPAGNLAVDYARSRKQAKPAAPAGRSLRWARDTRGFVRETSVGIVVVEHAPGLTFVGLFPSGAP